MQAGGGLLFQGLDDGSTLSLTESVVSDNYVDSIFTGSTSSGLGGKSLGHHDCFLKHCCKLISQLQLDARCKD